MIHFQLPIQAVAKGRPRFGRGRAYTPEKTIEFEKSVRLLARRYAPKEPLTGPLLLSVWFFLQAPKRTKNDMPIVKPDLDNLVKSLTDALNGIMWKDDSQVTDLLTQKRYVYCDPQIHVTILPSDRPYTLQFHPEHDFMGPLPTCPMEPPKPFIGQTK